MSTDGFEQDMIATQYSDGEPREIVLRNVILGMRPYILIQFLGQAGTEDDPALDMRVDYGEPFTIEDVPEMLRIVADSMDDEAGHPPQNLTLAEVRNGTGWPEGVRFRVLDPED